MADTKISALSSATTLGGTEILAGVQAAASVGITANQLKTWASASPTLVTPTLGVATATSVNKVALTAPASGSTLTIADGKTFTVSNTLTLTATDSSTLAIGAGGTLASAAYVATGTSGATIPLLNAANTFSATQTFNASGSIALGANSGNLGSIKLFGSTSGDVTVKPAAAAGTATVFQLPADNGTNTYVLQTNGSGVTSWVAASGGGTPGGSNTQLQYNNSSAFGGAAGLTTDGTNLTLGSSSTLLWSTDLKLTRAAAASLQLGAADAAAPVAQSLGVQNVVSGTSNTAGADFTIAGSKGTGTGAGGSLLFKVAPAGGSGTSVNALATALTIASSKNATFAGAIIGDGIYANSIYDLNGTSFALTHQRICAGSASRFSFTSGADATGTEDTILTRVAAGILKVADGSTGPGVIVTQATTVASLPSASTAGAGARCFVTDANATTYLSIVAGSGSNKVPVVSNGTNWIIG